MQLQFRNTESSLHWHSDKSVPIFIQCFSSVKPHIAMYWSRAATTPFLHSLPCFVPVSTQKTHAEHHTSKARHLRPQDECTLLLSSLQQQCHVVLLHLGIWFHQCNLDKSRVRYEQRWRHSYGGSWSAIASAEMLGSSLWSVREDIFGLLPQCGVLPPQRASK